MTSAQVVETSVSVTLNSPSQDYTHPDYHNLPNYDMTPGFKPFTVLLLLLLLLLLLIFFVMRMGLFILETKNPSRQNNPSPCLCIQYKHWTSKRDANL